MKKKNRILRIIPTLNPAFGGPVTATLNSTKYLIKKGFKVDILTCDKKKSQYTKITRCKIINKGPSYFGSFFFSPILLFWLLKNKKNYDYFLIHIIWGFNNILARFFLKDRHSVFVHGCLHPSENKKNFFKTLKKKIYWWLVEKKNLMSSRSILLTSAIEENQLKKTFVNVNDIKKTLIRYGILRTNFNKKQAIILFNKKFPYLKKNNFYLYIGRIHPQKKCEIIIRAVNKIKKKFNKKILIIGPLDGSKYEKFLKYLIKKYGLENQIYIANSEYGIIKWGAILSSKAMISASQGENFGISFAESLSFGKPILTTYKVNIYKEILQFNAGLISKNNSNDFSKLFLKFESFNLRKLKKISKNSILCFKENFDLNNNENSLAKYIINEIKKI